MLRLRIVEKNNIDDETEIMTMQDIIEKTKPKRGRPRKNQTQTSQVMNSTDSNNEEETLIVPKKRGRKKKTEKNNNEIDNQKKTNINVMSIPIVKNFIVQLKIRSSDLEKIQTQFMNKSQKIGYDNINQQNLSNIDNKNNNNQYNVDEKYGFDEYSNLLNKLELPLVPVSHQISEKIPPNIQNVYQNIVIPISPENIPIKLFDESRGVDDTRPMNTEHNESFRNTSDLLLPLLDNNGHWAEKSPYACWNCDTYFSGTPIGIPDKENDGKFYCYGNFCSFECAARYLSDHENNLDFWNKYSLLCLIYQKAYNLPPDTKVSFAPPKETLNKYGGRLTYESYHNANKNDHIVEIYKLPLVPTLLHIGELYRSINATAQLHQKSIPTQSKIRKFIPIDPNKISKAEENIKQKTNTLLRSTYTLDKCLNLNN